MTVVAEGTGVFLAPDPDAHRRYIRDHKEKGLVSKVMSESEAVERFVDDGDYVAYDCNLWVRGPAALMREIVRQKKRELWIAAKFTAHDATMLVAAGCVNRIDVGWMEVGKVITEAQAAGDVQLFEWSNGAMTYRLLAGSLGVPFLPLRYLGGTDVFKTGTKLIEDPYTGKPINVIPALNPDVALVHVNQCDEYGNSRIFGSGLQPVETAMAAKKVIISTEEIVSTDEIRRDPQKTRIPYYAVDAVVHLPFGGYPGTVPGLYKADLEHLMESGGAQMQGKMDEYLNKWIHSVSSNQDMLEKHVGQEKLDRLKAEETIKEGYYA
jgi:acyl CoA:acetate/3-ketoacid CoA transferase alpha subunit